MISVLTALVKFELKYFAASLQVMQSAESKNCTFGPIFYSNMKSAMGATATSLTPEIRGVRPGYGRVYNLAVDVLDIARTTICQKVGRSSNDEFLTLELARCSGVPETDLVNTIFCCGRRRNLSSALREA